MKRLAVALVAVLLLVGAVGCDVFDLTGASSRGSLDGKYLSVVEENGAGWVEVATTAGGKIHWGDSFADDAYTIAKGPGMFTHYYDEPGVYGIRLLSGGETFDAAIVPIPHVAGHLVLAQNYGGSIIVEWYGPADRYQWIVWGDSDMTTVTHDGNGHVRENRREHTYSAPGTYEVGIRGDVNGGDEYRTCFTVTVGE